MKEWVGNAHRERVVRCLKEKSVGGFDFRSGREPKPQVTESSALVVQQVDAYGFGMVEYLATPLVPVE
jgi:hypothetical protein